ncbi:LRR receptor-like serine/threonine-protein kinase EFR [Ananas comosus]|uniref:non-specific serine/threonine protein kinase n=1 Tax=Ananas comosus TaxID=4615 RepID=A0A199VFF6_ANACO|nr:LRR receptor-like serine/threonine-protein kinase EFR [Ananas comosus]
MKICIWIFRTASHTFYLQKESHICRRIAFFAFLVMLMLLLLIFFIFPRLAVSVHHSNATDLAALLSFKSLVRDPDGLLHRSWNSNNTSFCTWFGVSCSPRRQRVVALQLEGLSLHGTISPHLGNLSFMNRLDLSNNSLRGPIPHSLGQLPRLASLALGHNQLSGRIPSAVFNMSSLTYISFIKNNLSGPLLTDTVDNITIPHVQYLSIESNQLRGSIPSDFLLRCKDLQYLSLSTNQFRGSIPEELTRLQQLRVLYLDGNSLTGSIPTSIGNLTYLTKLDLSSNHLSGVIPPVLGGLTNLQWLTLGSNYLTGGIPTSLLNASMMGLMDLSDNNLTGTVPTEIGKSLPHLTFLGFGTNELSGGLEFITSLSHCKGLQRLHISYNELEGAIPNSIGNLSGSLYEFDACGNRITGEIPTTLGNLSGLLELCFDSNQLTGNIPITIFNLEGLQVLELGQNNLSGSIPDEIGRLSRLGELALDYNALSGAIPDSIGNVSALQFLWLDNNKLSSSIPDSIWSLSNLVGMYLSQNTLEGSISPEVGNLVGINQLDLSVNRLFGDIPDTFGQLQILGILNVSNNSFQGPIPESFSKLTGIQYLDLSLNEFSGPIPEFLADLRQLVGMNLSFNKFEGQVPTGGIFSNVSSRSLMGNMNLCGSQELGLSPCSKSRSNRVHKLKIILPTIAASIIIFFSCLAILLATKLICLTEYGSTGRVSRRGDVYSYGILLLETFTGKKPTDSMFSGESNLRKWVFDAYNARLSDAVDANLLGDESSDGRDTLDDCLSSVIELALECSKDSPKERITMKEVVSRMQKIQTDNFTDHTALLSFKSHIQDPNGILDKSWNSNTSFCSWIGVSCSSR